MYMSICVQFDVGRNRILKPQLKSQLNAGSTATIQESLKFQKKDKPTFRTFFKSSFKTFQKDISLLNFRRWDKKKYLEEKR